MARYTPSTLSLDIAEYFSRERAAITRSPFEPIRYTSLRAWLALNYLVLVLMGLLAALLVVLVLNVVHAHALTIPNKGATNAVASPQSVFILQPAETQLDFQNANVRVQ